MGRPSLYSPELALRIFAQIADGKTLNAICADEGMPAASTVRSWIADDIDGIAALSARAYKIGRAAIAEDCIAIADDPDGDAPTKKVRIDTRLRLLGKWAPNEYGDRMTLAGDADNPIMGMTEAQVDARLAVLQAKLLADKPDA
jgi:hypothetical protein